MGFDINSHKAKAEEQLSLFDFQMPKADFTPVTNLEEGSSAIDFNAFLMAHSEPEQSKTPRFVTLSATLHAAVLLVVALMSVPLVEQVKTETITIEIEDPKPIMKAPRGERVPPTQGGTPALMETPKVESIEDVGSPAAAVAVAVKAPAKASKAVTKAAPAKAGKSVAAKTTFKAVPMTIDDIEAPELDQGELASAAVASPMSEDFNEDFEKVDSRHKARVAQEKQNLDKMAAALAEEQDENLNSLQELNQKDSAKLAAMQEDLRRRNSQSIASALASERAAALAAAAREAAAKKAASQQGGLGGDGNGLGTKQGAGAGNSGSQTQGTQLAGLPSGIRSLDQLRQMPGNPRPQYDREERRRGDQGQIVFIAYISKAGVPSQFRMQKSTGFRNLDSKTLAALKKWRFYPGQEGWVELPFRWDLKGEVQEYGGTLRHAGR